MRIITAFKYFFKILAQGEAALPQAQTSVEVRVEEKPVFHVSSAPAVQVLGLLQKDGRFVDFIMEDLSAYSDQDVGAAVRDIHAGCRKVLNKYFSVVKIYSQGEGSRVQVEEGFDPSKIEIQGDISGKTRFSGELLHGGWYAQNIQLPTVAEGADDKVIAPAQVEVLQ